MPYYCRVTVRRTTVRQKRTSVSKLAGSIYPQFITLISKYVQNCKTADRRPPPPINTVYGPGKTCVRRSTLTRRWPRRPTRPAWHRSRPSWTGACRAWRQQHRTTTTATARPRPRPGPGWWCPVTEGGGLSMLGRFNTPASLS